MPGPLNGMQPADWAARAHEEEHYTTAQHQSIDIVQSILLHEQSPSSAAAEIDRIHAAVSSDTRDRDIYRLWYIICDAARHCGNNLDHSQRLADLIIAIQALPDMLDASGLPAKGFNDQVIWREMPNWHIVVRTHGVVVNLPDSQSSSSWEWTISAQALRNMTVFLASLITRTPFRTALAGHTWSPFADITNHSSEDLEQRHSTEIHLPAAATWILMLGRKLRDAGGSSLPRQGQDEGSGELAGILPPEKWDALRRGFEEIAADTGFSEDGRNWARRAAAYMHSM